MTFFGFKKLHFLFIYFPHFQFNFIGLAVWMLFVTYRKLPVSTGHSVIGATIGFSAVLNGFNAIRWSQILSISNFKKRSIFYKNF
jgi:hypothetical protein